MEEGKKENSENPILEAAMRILSYSPQFSGVLKRKLLQKKFSISEIEKVIEKLEELELLNDRRLAILYACELVRNKLYGINKIRAKLTEKGVCQENIKEAIQTAFEENGSEMEICRKYQEKKSLKGLSPEKRKQKLMAHGFTGETVQKCLFWENQEEELF